jgi:hypothetical protein
MQNAKRTGQIGKEAAVARVAVAAPPAGDGLVELAILSLAGLCLSVFVISQGWGAGALRLFAQ